MRATVGQARLLLALREGPGSVEELALRAHDGATAGSLRARLRRMEDRSWVRRTDERIDGSHVWQLTSIGRVEASRARGEMPHVDDPAAETPDLDAHLRRATRDHRPSP